MKYFIVTYTIRDGEYEYMTQTPVKAKTTKEASKKVGEETKEWIENDYREFDIDGSVEITKNEYDIIKKYIY